MRWSTKRQNNENRDSKARQEKSAAEWIKKHSNGEYILSTNVFIADGKSASKGEHIAKDEFGKAKGELAKFIEQVKDGTISADSILLFDSWDRFSRLPVRKTIALLNDVVDNCGGIVVTGSRDKRVLTAKLIDEDEYLLSGIIGEMNRATHESSEKRRKIMEAQERKLLRLKNGEILKHHCAPKYYSYNKDNKCYEQNKVTPIVEGIIKDYLAGKSLYEISKNLNDNKIRSIRYAEKQANWSRMAIKSLLESKCLYGEFLGIANYFGKPVIDKPTYDEIQMLLNRNSGNKGKFSSDFINIFRGIAYCGGEGGCGRHMVTGCQKMNYKAGKLKATPYRYLRCSSRANGLPCDNHGNINLSDIESSFFIDYLAKNPIDHLDKDGKQEIKAINAEIVAKQTRLDAIMQEVADLGKMIGIFKNSADLLKQAQEKKNEQDNLQKDIVRLNNSKTKLMATPVSRDLIMSVIEFDGDGIGKDNTTNTYSQFSVAEVEKNLQDNNIRLKLRNHLPNLVSKIVFDFKQRTYRVFNRDETEVFKYQFDEQAISAKVLKHISSKSERAKTLKMTGKGELQAYLDSLKATYRAKELLKQSKKSHTITDTLNKKKQKKTSSPKTIIN